MLIQIHEPNKTPMQNMGDIKQETCFKNNSTLVRIVLSNQKDKYLLFMQKQKLQDGCHACLNEFQELHSFTNSQEAQSQFESLEKTYISNGFKAFKH